MMRLTKQNIMIQEKLKKYLVKSKVFFFKLLALK